MFQSAKRLVARMVSAAGYELVRSHDRHMLGLTRYRIGMVIDVGANTGQFARRAHGLFPEAHIVCLEPLPGPFALLAAWASTMQGCVQTFQLALGAEEGLAEMEVHEHHDSSSSILPSTALSHSLYPDTTQHVFLTVPVMTLDEFMRQQGLTITEDLLIKADVQGYEDRVIAGGYRTFQSARACILEVCLDPLYHGQAPFTRLVNQMEEVGLRYAGNLEQVQTADGHVVYLDAVFLRM